MSITLLLKPHIPSRDFTVMTKGTNDTERQDVTLLRAVPISTVHNTNYLYVHTAKFFSRS
jgi:hypothetical protein